MIRNQDARSASYRARQRALLLALMNFYRRVGAAPMGGFLPGEMDRRWPKGLPQKQKPVNTPIYRIPAGAPGGPYGGIAAGAGANDVTPGPSKGTPGTKFPRRTF